MAVRALSHTGATADDHRRALLAGGHAEAQPIRFSGTELRSAAAALRAAPTPPATMRFGPGRAVPNRPDTGRVAASLDLVADIVERADQTLTVVAARTPRTALVDAGVGRTAPRVRAQVSEPERVDDAVDQDDMRRLARHWELSDHEVQCRSVVSIGGDSRTQFLPPEAPNTLVNRVHAAMTLAALSLWPILLQTAGALIAAAVGFGFRRLRATALTSRPDAVLPGDAHPFSPRELRNHCWQFFGLGRVVFESGGSGADAVLRTALHPSGDIETSVLRAAVSSALVEAHCQVIEVWLRRLEVTLERFTVLLSRLVLGLYAIPVVAFGTAVIRSSLTSLIVAAALAAVPLVLHAVLRYYVRRRLAAILPQRTDRIVRRA